DSADSSRWRHSDRQAKSRRIRLSRMPRWRAPGRPPEHTLAVVRAAFPLFVPFCKKSLTEVNLCEIVRKSTDKELRMDLYFAPLACSMATRIALSEAGADARFIQVDT